MSTTPPSVTRSILDALSAALDLPVTLVTSLPTPVRRRAVASLSNDHTVAHFAMGHERYLAARYQRNVSGIVVLGPFQRPDDPDHDGACRLLDAEAEARATAVLATAAEALAQVEDERLQRLELATRLEVTSRSVLAITAELDLHTVLYRIVDLAREIAGAKYAALGVPNDRGEMEAFLTSGMTPEEEARISHRPRGLGILGLLLTEPRTIRLTDLSRHPASAGFPEHHPPMTSFLGVPIVSRGQVLGNLYLTEKRFAREFTDNDARQVELLALHAAVAIENARLYSALDIQQRRLQLFLDQLPEAVLFAERNPDRITLANRQTFELLGWVAPLPLPIDEFFARNQRFTPAGAPLSYDQLALYHSLTAGETVSRRELRILRPDGRQITVLVNSAPVLADDGRIAGAITVFQDITQIKDAEQLKDDFLSLVSHELRTPLTTIQGGSLLLLQGGDDIPPDTRHDILRDVSTEARRLGTLIENMVQLANIRAGRMVMETDLVHVRKAIEHAVQADETNAPGRELRITSEPNLFALADPGRLDQLLRNLVHNALKYAPGAAPVEIDARRITDLTSRTMIEISVRDYGPGIAESDLPYVFDRFHRSREAVARGTPGMGLGLYLARHLVEAHGGRIWVERPQGGGTRVAFTLPDGEEPDEE